MGNVPIVKLVGNGKENKLTKFQQRKLKYDFDTFFGEFWVFQYNGKIGKQWKSKFVLLKYCYIPGYWIVIHIRFAIAFMLQSKTFQHLSNILLMKYCLTCDRWMFFMHFETAEWDDV